MTLANVALAGQQGMHSSVRPEFVYRVTLDLDAAYPDGGYTSFAATTLAAVIGKGKTVINIIQANPCGGYALWWDRVNDKLMVYQYPTSLGPSTQVPGDTDLALITGCEIMVYAA